MFKSWTSVRVLNMLKQASAAASETATEDQASDHTSQNHLERIEFDLDVTEAQPTQDQLQTILEYVGKSSIGSIVKGASGQADAMKKFGENAKNFQRPLIVDWSNAKAIPGESESEILKMLGAKPGFGKQQ